MWVVKRKITHSANKESLHKPRKTDTALSMLQDICKSISQLQPNRMHVDVSYSSMKTYYVHKTNMCFFWKDDYILFLDFVD